MSAFEVEQALRRSHCDRKENRHACAGTLSVTPTGIVLSCPLCGTGDGEALYGLGQPVVVSEKARDLAQRFARTLGVDWTALSSDTQYRAARLAHETLSEARP